MDDAGNGGNKRGHALRAGQTHSMPDSSDAPILASAGPPALVALSSPSRFQMVRRKRDEMCSKCNIQPTDQGASGMQAGQLARWVASYRRSGAAERSCMAARAMRSEWASCSRILISASCRVIPSCGKAAGVL